MTSDGFLSLFFGQEYAFAFELAEKALGTGAAPAVRLPAMADCGLSSIAR